MPIAELVEDQSVEDFKAAFQAAVDRMTSSPYALEYKPIFAYAFTAGYIAAQGKDYPWKVSRFTALHIYNHEARAWVEI